MSDSAALTAKLERKIRSMWIQVTRVSNSADENFELSSSDITTDGK